MLKAKRGVFQGAIQLDPKVFFVTENHSLYIDLMRLISMLIKSNILKASGQPETPPQTLIAYERLLSNNFCHMQLPW